MADYDSCLNRQGSELNKKLSSSLSFAIIINGSPKASKRTYKACRDRKHAF
jgi:hypothetical protein